MKRRRERRTKGNREREKRSFRCTHYAGGGKRGEFIVFFFSVCFLFSCFFLRPFFFPLTRRIAAAAHLNKEPARASPLSGFFSDTHARARAPIHSDSRAARRDLHNVPVGYGARAAEAPVRESEILCKEPHMRALALQALPSGSRCKYAGLARD